VRIFHALWARARLTRMRDTECLRFLPGTASQLLLLCDHAGHALPAAYSTLGLNEQQRCTHVAWDSGAEGLTRQLAHGLACPAFFGVWSRLLVDLNRHPEAADLIVVENDGIHVSGNLGLTDRERELRLSNFHRPYHLAIQDYLVGLEAHGIRPLMISIHSFTPVFNGVARPWQIGVLWKQRTPWQQRLIAALQAQGLAVGDNQPYDGRAALGHTLEHHAIGRGLPHVLIEVRQDLLVHAADYAAWAQRITHALREAGLPTG